MLKIELPKGVVLVSNDSKFADKNLKTISLDGVEYWVLPDNLEGLEEIVATLIYGFGTPNQKTKNVVLGVGDVGQAGKVNGVPVSMRGQVPLVDNCNVGEDNVVWQGCVAEGGD